MLIGDLMEVVALGSLCF